MKRFLIAALTLGATAAAAVPLPAEDAPPARDLRLAHERTLGHRRPGIRVWILGSEVFRRGERARVYYRTERDAYVTIFRVDTDGRVRVLFPVHPFEDNFVRGGYTHHVQSYGRDAFVVDEYPGVGYVFGVASDDPFLYDPIVDDDHWDYGLIADGRIHGDPYQSLEEVAGRLLPPQYVDFDTHLLPYYVERRYDYPRFVCYDCHTYTPWSYWDPYSAYCSRFTLVIWRDPYYYYPSYWYPTRYYGGTRVVYVQPGVARDGRFVFKARESSTPGVEYRDRRGDATASRRPPERYVRATDVGGVGSVPVPASGRRMVPGGQPHDERPPVIVGAGNRRRADADRPEPRAIVPGDGSREGSQSGGRRTAVGTGGSAATPRAADDDPKSDGRRAQAPEPRGGGERSADPGSAQGRPGVALPREDRPQRREPPRTEPSREPAREPARRSSPGAEPSREPERRQPERASQPRQQPARQPESRPRSEGRPQAQARPSESSRPAARPSPGLVRRRPD